MVPATVLFPHPFEFPYDPVDTVGEEPGEVQEPEGVEEVDLLFRQTLIRHGPNLHSIQS